MRTRLIYNNSWWTKIPTGLLHQVNHKKPNKAELKKTKQTKPLHKDASLHCVDNAAKAWLVFVTAHCQVPLPGKSGSQPVANLWWHWIWLDVTQLILWIHQPPAGRHIHIHKNYYVQFLQAVYCVMLCTLFTGITMPVNNQSVVLWVWWIIWFFYSVTQKIKQLFFMTKELPTVWEWMQHWHYAHDFAFFWWKVDYIMHFDLFLSA